MIVEIMSGFVWIVDTCPFSSCFPVFFDFFFGLKITCLSGKGSIFGPPEGERVL